MSSESYINKSELRKLMLSKRSSLATEEACQKSADICTGALFIKNLHLAKTIMFYYPLGNEVDLRPVIDWCRTQGKNVVLPKTLGNEIIPLNWDVGESLAEGEFHVMVPKNENICEPKKIDMIFVPGVAFDRSGNRIGFGRGYYDRFIKRANADSLAQSRKTPYLVGVCYEFQVSQKLIEVCEDDVPVHSLLTENGVLTLDS